MRGRNLAQEDAIFAPEEAFAGSKGEVLLGQRIGSEASAISLVSCQAFDVVEAVSGGGTAFMRGVIADEIGAATRNGLAPALCIVLERGFPEGLDFITDEAGDHAGGSLKAWGG